MDDFLAPGRMWKHKKNGHTYRIVCEAVIEQNLAPVVVYCRSGLYPPKTEYECWVRPREEFLDGRFEYIQPSIA